MKILFKYISKLFFGPFLIGLSGFIVFVSVELLYQLSNIIVRNRVGIEKLFVLIYYNLPSFAADGIPVGVLLAIFWTISSLSQRRELMAFQVHGISLKNLFFPFLILSAFLSIFVYLLNDFVVPNYYMKAERYMGEQIFKRPKVEDYIVSESVVRYQDKFIYVGEYDRKHEVMKNVMIIDYSGNSEKVMTAEKVYKEGKSWYLENGRLYIVDQKGMMRLDSIYKKLKLDFKEDLGALLAYPSERKMSHSELLKAINDTNDRKRAARWIVELHRRYATALAPVIIVLAGLSLSLLFNLTSKSWGVILTFVLVVLYQGSGAWLSAMGKEMIIDPVLSVWLPDIFFGGIGLVLLLFVDTTAVQRIREILVRIGIGIILVLSATGFGYTVSSDVAVLRGNVVTMSGNVEIYEKENLKAVAEKAVYYIDEDQIILINATSVGKDYKLKAATHLILNDISQDERVSGVISTNNGSVTIKTASFVVSSGDIHIIKNADLDISSDREKLTSQVKAVFIITKKKNVTNGMGKASGKRRDRDFIVDVARIVSSKDMEGVIGMMKIKLGKELKNMYFAGNSLIVFKDNLQLTGAYITTCSSSPPHYYVAFEKAYITDDYVVARNTVVFINDLPVVYFPYFFQFFKSSKPVSMSFGIGSKKKGVSFSFHTQSNGWKADYSKGENSQAFSMSGSVYGFPLSLGWKGGKTSLSMKKFLFGGSLGVSSSKNSVVYQYSLSKKVFKKGYAKFLIKRYYSSGKVSWILPNISLGKLKLVIPIFGGEFYLKSWKHSGSLSYKDGTFLSNMDKVMGSGKLSASYSKSIIKFIGTGVKTSADLTYSATPGNLKDYTFKQTTSFFVYNKSMKWKWFSLNAQRSFSLSTDLKKDQDYIGKTLNDFEKYGLSLKIPFFSSGLSYVRSAKYSGKEKLSQNSAQNKMSISSSFSFPVIPLSISASSGYDFLSKNPKFSYPDLKANSSFSIGDFSFSFSASTRYRYDQEKAFDKITFALAQSYKKKTMSNSMNFTYFPYEDIPIKEIVDKFSVRSFNLLGFPISSVGGIAKYNFSKNESKLTYFSTKVVSSFSGLKNIFSFKYSNPMGSGDSKTTYSYSLTTSKLDPAVKLKLGMNFKNLDLSSYNFSLSLRKDLHCWSMGLDLSGRMTGDGISFSRIFLSFSVNDWKGKGFNYDMLSGEYNLGLM